MPTAYFKCECGQEMRKVVPMDHSRDTYSERRRRWEFDPTKPVTVEMYPNVTVCKCGWDVRQSADPGMITTKLLFNYMEE
jgi:hypothetical protein